MERVLQEVADLKQSSIETKAKMYELHGLCPVRYNNKCFFAVIDFDLGVKFDIAEFLCYEKGAKLANIYSEKHLEALGDYIRPYLVLGKGEISGVSVHTGMKFNPITAIITLTDGTQSDLNRWFSGHPWYEPDRTIIELYTRKLGDSYEVSHYDASVLYDYHGALCEIDLA
uniref:uncharacterized protein LOC120343264 n=1 Tax=Styela clava TaxID=7725 RepID=UPI001939DE6B|nr:uncharacterized protein LOC120343264 [Styela clava]